VKRLLHRIGLGFPDPVEEQAFFQDFGTRYLAFIRFALVLGGALLVAFVIWDRMIDPVGARTTLWIRVLWLAPACWLCALLLSFRAGQRYIEPILIFGSFSTVAGIAAVCAILAGGYNLLAGAGLMLIVMFCFSLLPMRTPYYLLFCALTLLAYFVGQAFADSYLPGMPFINLLMITTALFIGGVSIVWREWNARAQFRAQQEIGRQHRRIEELLHSMLPADIVRRIQAGETRIADLHNEVSIVFSDLVGFTELSRRISPTRLVEILNLLFSEFDKAAESYGMHKIKTIGDSYMAVGGVVSSADADTAAANAAEFAFEMLRVTRRLTSELGLALDLRVGLHVGPVVAGVIGTSRPAFDCWGEAVNLASRLESAAGPGAVLISEPAWHLLKGRYHTEVLEQVTLKGIGTTKVFVLNSGTQLRLKSA
jgi:adenylate cyclase